MNDVDYILMCVNASNMCLSFMRDGFEGSVENTYWLRMAGYWTASAMVADGRGSAWKGARE